MSSKLPRLVGLIGRKGAGKDTAADLLLSRGYQNVKFAGALKDMIRCVLAYQGVDATTIERMIEGDLKEVPTDYLAGRTPRYAMQTLGTEWGRKLIGEDFWVGATLLRIKAFLTDNREVVVTDVRFHNEMDEIEEEGGVNYGVEADWIKPVEGEHESEALIDGLIATLPPSQRIVNRLAPAGQLREAIQEFQMRFLHMLQTP